jgi:hypothetical protein
LRSPSVLPTSGASPPPRWRSSARARDAKSRLRSSLNAISRFDFGALSELEHAREWQTE